MHWSITIHNWQTTSLQNLFHKTIFVFYNYSQKSWNNFDNLIIPIINLIRNSLTCKLPEQVGSRVSSNKYDTLDTRTIEFQNY